MSIPYFPMYPDDFEADTAHLSLAEDGAYNRLLRLQWRSPGCKLPADLPWIMRKMRANTEADREVVKVVLSEFFTRKGNRIFNDRLLKEWVKAVDAHERRISAGSKGGSAKAAKTKEKVPSNALALAKQPEPEPDIRDISSNEDIGISPLCDVSEAVAAYNAVASRAGWPQVQKMTDTRRRAARARLGEVGGMAGWRTVLEKAEASDFLSGRSGRWSGFGFDWLTSPKNLIKIMEGNYDNRRGAPSPQDSTLRAIANAAGAF